MNIYIIVEIKKREFISRLLLALEASLNGHSVYLGNVKQLLDNNLIRPGIIHHKSLTPNKNRIDQLKKLKEKNFFITSQDEEVGHVNIRAEEYVLTRYGFKTINLVDYVFTWGIFDYKNLLSKYSRHKNKIINSGNPRVDYWRKDFEIFYSKKKIKYFLISSNFENVFGQTNLYQKYKLLKKNNYFNLGMCEKILFKRMATEGILIDKYISIIKRLSKAFPKKNFLYRPHPIENPKHWKIIFEDCKNVEVDSSGNLSEVISNADLVMHNGCTGGLESAVRGVPTIAYMPIIETIGHPIANEVSIICKDENSFIKKVKQIYKSNSSHKLNKLQKKKINYRFENFFNKPSYKKIVNTWNKLNYGKMSFKNNDYLISLFFFIKKTRKFLSFNSYINTKFEAFSQKEVLEIKKKLTKINPKFNDVTIKFFGDDLIKLIYEKK